MTPTRIEIRSFLPTDEQDLIALWHTCELTRPWNDPAADIDLAMRTPSAEILVAFDTATNSVAGSIMVGTDGHRGWVYYLAVDPEHQRRGIGRQLMLAAEDWLRETGTPKLSLMVRAENEQAHAFYEALGYTVQPVSTFGKWLDPQDDPDL